MAENSDNQKAAPDSYAAWELQLKRSQLRKYYKPMVLCGILCIGFAVARMYYQSMTPEEAKKAILNDMTWLSGLFLGCTLAVCISLLVERSRLK